MSSSGETVQDGYQEYFSWLRRTFRATTETWLGESSSTSTSPFLPDRTGTTANHQTPDRSTHTAETEARGDSGGNTIPSVGMRRRSVDDEARHETTEPPQHGADLHRTTSTTSSRTKRRLSIGEKLKKLGREISVLGRGGGKGDGNEKGMLASPVTTTQPPSLPPTPLSSPITSGGHAKLLSMVLEGEEPVSERGEEDVPTTPTKPLPPEPESLAKKLQDLIDSLPFPKTGSGKPLPIVKNPKPPARDKDGRPIPPPNATLVKDSKLLSLLSSATFMNGNSERGRKSVWSVLEGLGVPPHGFPSSGDDGNDQERTGGGEDEGDGGGGHDTDGDGEPDVFADTSSVMVYSPLIPDHRALVELAELVDLEGDEGEGEGGVEEGTVISGTSWTQVWPLSAIWPSGSDFASSSPSPPHLRRVVSSEVLVPSTRISVDGSGRRVRIRTMKAWVPSDTKLSVQAMWWGYRLYLPPPVLEILDDKTLEATKRAAMITTALTWFFNNLPINSLPLPVRPALLLLQRIAPFVGYIGTFISWSWSTVKGYDIGFGVTLTATWLLPIALIPGTWREDDFPKSPSPASPIPLPPTSPPTSPPPALPSPPSSPPPVSPSLPNVPPNSPLPAPNPTPEPVPTPVPQPPAQLPTPAPTEPPTSLPITSPTPPTSPGPLGASISTDTSSTSDTKTKLSKWKRLVNNLPTSSSSSPSSPSTTPTPIQPPTPTPIQPPTRPPLSALDTAASGPHSRSPPVPLQVPPSSPLARRLLQGPLMNPVPLPDEDAPMPKFKERVKGVFKKRESGDLRVDR